MSETPIRLTAIPGTEGSKFFQDRVAERMLEGRPVHEVIDATVERKISEDEAIKRGHIAAPELIAAQRAAEAELAPSNGSQAEQGLIVAAGSLDDRIAQMERELSQAKARKAAQVALPPLPRHAGQAAAAGLISRLASELIIESATAETREALAEFCRNTAIEIITLCR